MATNQKEGVCGRSLRPTHTHTQDCRIAHVIHFVSSADFENGTLRIHVIGLIAAVSVGWGFINAGLNLDYLRIDEDDWQTP